MRGIVDFYRRNPVILVLAVVVGLVVSLSAAAGGGSIVTEGIAVGVVGLMLGLGIAWNRNRRAGD